MQIWTANLFNKHTDIKILVWLCLEVLSSHLRSSRLPQTSATTKGISNEDLSTHLWDFFFFFFFNITSPQHTFAKLVENKERTIATVSNSYWWGHVTLLGFVEVGKKLKTTALGESCNYIISMTPWTISKKTKFLGSGENMPAKWSLKRIMAMGNIVAVSGARGSPSSSRWGKEMLAPIFLSWKQKSILTTKTVL